MNGANAVHVMENGICVTCNGCGPREERKYNPAQLRDPGGEDGGQWTKSPGAEAANLAEDVLKLAGRIAGLGDGEHVTKSSKLRDNSNGDASMVMARIDGGKDGPSFRVGLVLPEHTRDWRAANKGSTAVFDTSGLRQLREAFAPDGVLPEAKQSIADYNDEVAQAHRLGLPKREWPNPEKTLYEGVIRGEEWADLHWSLNREEGTGELAAHEGYPDATWSMTFEIRPKGSDGPGAVTFSAETPAKLKALDKAFADMLATR